jgi:hypothetical protein
MVFVFVDVCMATNHVYSKALHGSVSQYFLGVISHEFLPNQHRWNKGEGGWLIRKLAGLDKQ